MRTTITTAQIPKQIPKHVRARLLKAQRERIVTQMSKHWFLWEPQTMKAVIPYDSNLNPCGLTQGFADAMSKTEIKWVITCYILSRQRNGKNELTEEVFQVNTPCKHSDISHLAADYHWNMIEEFRSSRKSADFITAGWVANMVKSPTLDEAFELFQKIGAWDLPSDREEQLNNDNGPTN